MDVVAYIFFIHRVGNSAVFSFFIFFIIFFYKCEQLYICKELSMDR